MKKLLIYLSIFCMLFLVLTPLFLFAKETPAKPDAEESSIQPDIKTLQENLDKGLQDIKQAVTDKRIDDLRMEMNKRIETMQMQLNQCLEIIKKSDLPDEKNTAMEKPEQMKLGRWWLKSPLSYRSMPDKVLNHFELSYSWVRMTGDMTVDKSTVKAMHAIRFKRVTNFLKYTFDKRNSAKADDFDSYLPYTFPSGAPTIVLPIYKEKNLEMRTSEMQEIHDDLRIAVYKNFYLAPGFKYYEDDFIQVDKRLTAYMGAGGSLFDNKYISFQLFGALGYEELEYIDQYHKDMADLKDVLTLPDLENQYGKENVQLLNDELSNYEEDTVKNRIFYLDYGFNIFPTENITISNVFNYIREIRDPDKYRWTVEFELSSAIAKNVQLTCSYTESFDNAMSLLAGRKRNITSRLGIRLSF
ncbi:MAG: DUF481 domain-containing protein [Candidatus Magnetomorum sp.]|nr:DUF481 domain-containing protein [Candidatus Magnetomorum sp.]